MKPPKFKKPTRDAEICRRRAQGHSLPKIAKDMGIGMSTAHRVSMRFEDWVAEQRERHTRKVLTRLDRATDARLDDAETRDSKTGAQSYRVVLESVGWVGKGDTHVHGDVSVQVLNLDASRHLEARGLSLAELREQLRELE